MNRFLIGLILFISTNTQALYWQNNYGVSLELGTDDNYFLTPANEQEVNSSKLGLSASGNGSSETSTVNFGARINTNNFSLDTIDDSPTGALFLGMANQGERLYSNLDLSYRYQSTQETELLDSGLRVDGRKETVGVTPGLSYQVNERHSLSANLGLQSVSYSTTTLTDYINNNLGLSWGYSLNETSDFSTNLNYTRYEPDNNASTETAALYLGYVKRSSETTTYDFTLGYTTAGDSITSTGSTTYRLLITNDRDDFNSFSLRISQLYNPSSLGIVRLENRLTLGWQHAFTEHFDGSLTAEYLNYEGRDYYELAPGIRYRFSEHMDLGARYRYRLDDREGVTGNAESNSVFLTLSYNR
jgi:hypothetical protein